MPSAAKKKPIVVKKASTATKKSTTTKKPVGAVKKVASTTKKTTAITKKATPNKTSNATKTTASSAAKKTSKAEKPAKPDVTQKMFSFLKTLISNPDIRKRLPKEFISLLEKTIGDSEKLSSCQQTKCPKQYQAQLTIQAERMNAMKTLMEHVIAGKLSLEAYKKQLKELNMKVIDSKSLTPFIQCTLDSCNASYMSFMRSSIAFIKFVCTMDGSAHVCKTLPDMESMSKKSKITVEDVKKLTAGIQQLEHP